MAGASAPERALFHSQASLELGSITTSDMCQRSWGPPEVLSMDNAIKIILSMLAISGLTFSDDSYTSRISIPIGSEANQVQIDLLDQAIGLYGIMGFFVDSECNFYFEEDSSRKIKVFSSSGKFIKAIDDYSCISLMLYKDGFIGIRQNEKANHELICFSKEDGKINYRSLMPDDNWGIDKIKDTILLFNDAKYPIGKSFDLNKKRFIPAVPRWKNKTEKYAFSTYANYGLETVGWINNWYLFSLPPPPQNASYEYSLNALNFENNKKLHLSLKFHRQEVGEALQGPSNAIWGQRYFYTLGYHKEGAIKDIWVTRIDLAKIMPDLFNFENDSLKK